MDDWDQEKLESVVTQKHGAEKGALTKTDIICKFFLDALERKQYGWYVRSWGACRPMQCILTWLLKIKDCG